MKPTCSGRIPAPLAAVRRVVAVDLLLLDVDEPERRSRSTQTGPSPSSAARSQTDLRLGRSSAPPGVDEIFVTGDQPRIVRGEEQDHRGNVSGTRRLLQALRVDDLGLALGRVPLQLARRADVAGNDAVDADIVAARGRARARGSGLRSRPCRSGRARSSGRREVPADRAEVDDHAAALAAHARNHRLRAEELVLEVHVETIVPIVLGDLVEIVAVVIGGIVDKHVERPISLDQPVDALLRRRHIGQIEPFEARDSVRLASSSDSPFRMSMKVTSAPWLRKASTMPAPMPRAAAGDQHALAAQARIDCAQLARLSAKLLSPRCRRSWSACRIRPPRSPARARRSSTCACRRTARDNRRRRSAG